MAKNITVQALGGQPKVIEANTVAEAFASLGLTGNYTASVNGNPAQMSDSISEYNFVSFAQAVKGGTHLIGSFSSSVKGGQA